jgi:hypothetical protein
MSEDQRVIIMWRKTALSPCLMALWSSLAFGAGFQSEVDQAHEQIVKKEVAVVHGTRRPTLNDRVKAMAAALGLTEPQQAALTKILEERQEATLRLRRDTSIPGSIRIERFRYLQDQTVLRIRSILNEEQKKKYDPLAARKIEPSPQERSVDDWLKVTTPAIK